MSTRYETDVMAWANEQARLIRAGRFDLLDLEHIAEEIKDVGKSEQRELANRMAVLLAHLLKWQYQPDRRGSSRVRTIKEQRKRVCSGSKKPPACQTNSTMCGGGPTYGQMRFLKRSRKPVWIPFRTNAPGSSRK